jgi:AraC-like DNA-binding protein
MKLSVSSFTHDDFMLLPITENEYPDDALPGSEISHATGIFGKVVLQQIIAKPIHILYNYYNIQERCVLRFTGEASPLCILVVLKGNGHFLIDGIGNIYLEQGQFNILYTPNINSTAIFGQEGDILTFSLFLPLDVLHELAPMFPLQEFIDECGSGLPVLQFGKPGWITAETIREISYMLNFREAPPFREYLFVLKAKQLLHLLLLQKFHTRRKVIAEETLESIRKARHIIESGVGEVRTAEKIAGLAGISEHELKKYFKPVVGYPLSTFIVHARLNNARLLLQETNLSIRQIAQMTGYSHEHNFVQAFKKRFDYTPFFLRQMRE